MLSEDVYFLAKVHEQNFSVEIYSAMIGQLIAWIIISVSIHGCAANAAQKENPLGEIPGAETRSERESGQLIVVFIKGTSEEKIKEINKTLKVNVLDESFGYIYLIEVPKEKSLEELRKDYLHFPEVATVNFNLNVRPQK